ncbi:hypothetical protein GRX01_00635 [Halobaculum sp. WSA2]|uniref:Uncharacterized protein n=1 Tax=Halobaculum saliterrae TaxID=2073113 RepID=A0A6B0SZN3_9EURY|nr:hypothetical protein [Halobaculum saliterrae]MXR39869.1 hypothetical protein [Halobaculum saliterrae]
MAERHPNMPQLQFGTEIRPTTDERDTVATTEYLVDDRDIVESISR